MSNRDRNLLEFVNNFLGIATTVAAGISAAFNHAALSHLVAGKNFPLAVIIGTFALVGFVLVILSIANRIIRINKMSNIYNTNRGKSSPWIGWSGLGCLVIALLGILLSPLS